MYVTPPSYDSFFQYGNRQIDYSPSSFALFPVTAAKMIAQQRKEHSFSPSKKDHNKAAFDEVLIELTGKGQYINEHI
jgi:hypothetical protein